MRKWTVEFASSWWTIFRTGAIWHPSFQEEGAELPRRPPEGTALVALLPWECGSDNPSLPHPFQNVFHDSAKKPWVWNQRWGGGENLKNVFFSWRNFPFMSLIPLSWNPGSHQSVVSCDPQSGFSETHPSSSWLLLRPEDSIRPSSSVASPAP